LPRQGSLTLPSPLCRKTVEEVWSEIHGDQNNSTSDNNNGDNVRNPESAPRQPTFGEMTLEDFLIKAGVVRETSAILPASQPQPQQQQYGVYQNSNPTVGPTFVNMPMIGLSGAAGGGLARAEQSGYAGNSTKMSTGGYPQQQQPPAPPLAVCYGGRLMNGGGGYGAAPVSPVSSDGMCTTQVDNSASQFELEMGGLRGRKRIIDGPVEKVVERRQRRMIKNRESAARSRARKQVIKYSIQIFMYLLIASCLLINLDGTFHQLIP
jgi:ABA responsive element binding factor